MRRRDFLLSPLALYGCNSVAINAPGFNPPVAGGGEAGATSDEITSYPAGTPHALVSPVTYTTTYLTPQVTVQLSKPRIVYELYQSTGSTAYLWFSSVAGFARSGALQVSALLTEDSLEFVNQSNVVINSSDFGVNWSAETQYDSGGTFIVNEWWDSTTSHALFWNGVAKPAPLGQHRNYKFHRGYYANSGSKRVLYPWASTLTGLPWDLKVYVPTVTSAPRHTWDHIQWDCKPIQLANGDLLAVIWVTRTGQTLSTLVCMKSIDKGVNWTYLSTPGGLESQGSEAALLLTASGDVVCYYRNEASVNLYYARSEDSGATWTTGIPVEQTSTPHGGPGGPAGIGFVAPNACRLDNGVVVVLAGRGASGLGLGVCVDGANDPLYPSFNSEYERIVGPIGGIGGVADHHNLYDEGAAAGVPMKIRAIANQDKSTNYWDLWQVGPNRLVLVYDFTPQERGYIGQSSALPNQIYCIDATFSIP